MVVSEKMYELGSKRSAIRELFEYGKQRAAVVGAENVYDFSIGNPSIPAPDCVNETIRELTEQLDSLSLHGYTSAQGDARTRTAIAEYLNKEHGTAFSEDNFYITMGAAASLSICFKALTCSSEDEFIIIAPFFPEYKVFIEAAGAVPVIVPADTEEFQIRFDELEKRINPHTKGIVINSPNNPSGAIYSEETIRTLAELLNRKQEEYHTQIFLLADEPYREIAFDGKEVPYASLFYPRTISCYSFSKSLSLPGERIGYVAVNPESGVSAMLVNMCGQISRGIGHNCPSSVIQLAAADCCDLTSDLSVYETNMNLLYDALTALGFDIVRPGGTFYLFPKALESDAAAFSRKALPYGLILVPSDSFGLPGYFRIAFCTDTEKVVRSIDAFKAFVKAEY